VVIVTKLSLAMLLTPQDSDELNQKELLMSSLTTKEDDIILPFTVCRFDVELAKQKIRKIQNYRAGRAGRGSNHEQRFWVTSTHRMRFFAPRASRTASGKE
jgi:hypothetical protein